MNTWAMEGAEKKYVVFRVADERFGLPIESVERILPEQHPTRIPRTPNMILGVFELRGEAIPAVDLRVRFDFPRKEGRGHYMVMKCQGERIACRVDSVDGIKIFSEIDTDCGFFDSEGFMHGVAKDGDDLVVILRADEVVPSSVRKKAVKLAA